MKQLNLCIITLLCSILAIGALSSCIDKEGPQLKDSITLSVDLSDIIKDLKADNEAAIQKLRDELEKMKGEQGASEEKITKLVNKLIDEAKGDLSKELGILKASLQAVNDKVALVDDLLARTKSAEDKIKVLETAIKADGGKIEALEAKQTELEGKGNKNEASIRSLEHRVNRLQGIWANMTMEGVDLGDGISVLWAPMNLGAANETRFGGYYAWGELIPKDHVEGETSNFTKENYKFYKDGNWTKYGQKGGLKVLAPEDDAATQTLGKDKGWRMPTKKEFEELITNCTFEYKENYKGQGTHGILVTSKKEPKNSIFIPYGGYYEVDKTEKPNYGYTRAYLWTANSYGKEDRNGNVLYKTFAFSYYKDRTNVNDVVAYTYGNPCGMNIRPVKDKPKKK